MSVAGSYMRVCECVILGKFDIRRDYGDDDADADDSADKGPCWFVECGYLRSGQISDYY